MENKIALIRTFFENNDLDLGFRRLLDCVIDTQQMEIYQKAIALTDWKYSSQYDEQTFKEKAIKLLDLVAQIKLIPAERNVVLSAENVVKSYAKGFTLGPVSVSIEKGHIFGLVGENGNGKTTLLRVLAKELYHDSGQITYNLKKKYTSDYDLRTRLVYIPQRTKKWHGSLQDNLKFVLANYGVPAKEIETRMLIMIARFGLWEYKDLQWNELSSGYKMRFELVRTMLRQPEVLLLDEPLANLDVLAQQVILEDLKSIADSVTNPIAIILSSQQLYEVEKISHKVLFLKKGKQTKKDADIQQTDELVVELETNCSKNELEQCFKELHLKKIVFNGGLYFAYFDKETSFKNVLSSLAKSDLDVIYLRNISTSTRRFFVN